MKTAKNLIVRCRHHKKITWEQFPFSTKMKYLMTLLVVQ